MNTFRPAIGPLHVWVFAYMDRHLYNKQRFDANVNGGSGWPSTNMALYFPVHFPFYWTARRFMVVNSTATNSFNLDIGIYDAAGKLIVSTGATARGTASTCQYISCTDTNGSPGRYYFGMVFSNTTSTMFNGINVANIDRIGKSVGVLQESLGSTALPSTMTPASVGTVRIPSIGFTQSETL